MSSTASPAGSAGVIEPVLDENAPDPTNVGRVEALRMTTPSSSSRSDPLLTVWLNVKVVDGAEFALPVARAASAAPPARASTTAEVKRQSRVRPASLRSMVDAIPSSLRIIRLPRVRANGPDHIQAW